MILLFFCSATKLNEKQWQEMRAIYLFLMTRRLVKLIKRHKDQLFTNHPVIKRKLSAPSPSSNGTVITNGSNSNGIKKRLSVPSLFGDRDLNGFPIDNDRIFAPDDKLWSAKSFAQLDEHYTRYR